VSIYESTTAAPVARHEWRTQLSRSHGPFLLAGLAVASVILTNLVDLHFDGLGIRLLNANSASSWSHRADAAMLAAGAVLALFGARRSTTRRRLWISVAVILALFLFDEVSSLHAHIDQLTRFDRISYGKLLYAPLLLVLVISICRLAAGTDQVSLLLVGLLTLLVSYLTHVFVLSLVIGWGYYSWAYQAVVGIKEGAALGGLVLLLSALWRLKAGSGIPMPPASPDRSAARRAGPRE
jgi:hypothetical protein